MYSPQITDLDGIPHEQYDEWLIFDNPPEKLRDVEVFINYGGFSLATLEQVHDPWDSTWDKSALDIDRKQRERFWSQLVRISPESYLAEGDVFLFASRNGSLVTSVSTVLGHNGIT